MRTHFNLPVVSLCLLALPFGAAFSASGLEQFKSGDPAKAELVNKNFRYLDSTKAEQTDLQVLKYALTAKVDHSSLDSAISQQIFRSTKGLVTRDTLDSLLNKKANALDIAGFIKNDQSIPIKVSDSRTISSHSVDGFRVDKKSGELFGLTSNGISYQYPQASAWGQKIVINQPGVISFSFADMSGIYQNQLSILSGSGIQVNGDINLTGTLIAPTKSFPDFVFSPAYKLQPLSETKAFITQNGHLPNIPSAKDVEKSGMDLVQMNQVLLQKVEELTLHAIAQQERINALEARLPAP